MTYMINQIYHVVMILIFMMMFMMIVCFALYMSATRKKKQRREADMYFQSLDRKDLSLGKRWNMTRVPDGRRQRFI